MVRARPRRFNSSWDSNEFRLAGVARGVDHAHMTKSGLIVLLALVGLAQAQEFTYQGEALNEPAVLAWREASLTVVPGETIRVAAYNIEHFTDGLGDGPERTPERLDRQARMAAGLLNSIKAQVVLLMETESTNSLAALRTHLDPAYAEAYITQLGDGAKDDQKMNLAVLSRLPLVEVKEVDFGPLTGPGRPTRGFLRAIADLGDGHRLVVYAVHLKSNFGHRPRNIAQRRATLEMIAQDARALAASDPSIQWEMLVAGDTNVDPELPEFAGDASLKPLKEWKDLWRGRPLTERTTVPTRYGDPALEFPPACFDRLFASPALTQSPWVAGSPQAIAKGVQTQRVDAKPGEGDHISDHYPVYVDLVR